jgi:hypothetical protein
MKSVICFLVVVGSVFGAELPPAAHQAEMAYNKEYNEARVVFDTRVKAAQDKFITFLKNEMKRLTQAGDLDGALALKEKISSLEKSDEKSEKDENKNSIIGVWEYGNNTREFTNNGICILVDTRDNKEVWRMSYTVEAPLADGTMVILVHQRGGNTLRHTLKDGILTIEGKYKATRKSK